MCSLLTSVIGKVQKAIYTSEKMDITQKQEQRRLFVRKKEKITNNLS